MIRAIGNLARIETRLDPRLVLVVLMTVFAPIVVGGCASRRGDLRTRMEAYDPAERIRAIRLAGDGDRTELVPALVDRLDDEDPAVRMYAIVALEKLTGERRGYRYYDAPHVRRRCVEAWRAYVTERAMARRAKAEEAPAETPG